MRCYTCGFRTHSDTHFGESGMRGNQIHRTCSWNPMRITSLGEGEIQISPMIVGKAPVLSTFADSAILSRLETDRRGHALRRSGGDIHVTVRVVQGLAGEAARPSGVRRRVCGFSDMAPSCGTAGSKRINVVERRKPVSRDTDANSIRHPSSDGEPGAPQDLRLAFNQTRMVAA